MRLLRSEKAGDKASTAAVEKGQSSAKRPARNVSSKKTGGVGRANGSSSGTGNGSPGMVKKVEFTIKTAAASSVKLAADFTEWDKCAIEMMPSADGVWSAIVPLVPGFYSYRFIVDGNWCDDPSSGQRIPNPFGTENAVIQVV